MRTLNLLSISSLAWNDLHVPARHLDVQLAGNALNLAANTIGDRLMRRSDKSEDVQNKRRHHLHIESTFDLQRSITKKNKICNTRTQGTHCVDHWNKKKMMITYF